jgi:hypothetical protein
MNKRVTGGQLKKTREDLAQLQRIIWINHELIEAGGMTAERGQCFL